MVDHAASPVRLRHIGDALTRLDLRGLGYEAEAVRRRVQVVASDYLASRIDLDDDTIVIAVVGPTGGGKSTIVNTLARREITNTGPLRPTTNEPVAWANGSLPTTLDGLRTRLQGSVVDTLHAPPSGSVVVDTPPPDVVDELGVPIVRHVLDIADAAVFVVGASRYADAAGFDLLAIAAARRLPTVMVLNRLPDDPDAQRAIAQDFIAKLVDRGLVPRHDPGLVISIPEAPVASDTGGLDPSLIAAVAKDIEGMADPQARPEIIAGVVAASLRSVHADLGTLRRHVIDATVRRIELIDPVRAAYRRETRRLIGEIRGGRFRDVPVDRIGSVLASATTRRAGLAARWSAERWAEIVPDLVDSSPELFGHAVDTQRAALERFESWSSFELEALLERQGIRRRSMRHRLASELARVVLDAERTSSRRLQRVLSRHPGLVDAAWEALVETINGVVANDARRFIERAGPAPPTGMLRVLSGVDDE